MSTYWGHRRSPGSSVLGNVVLADLASLLRLLEVLLGLAELGQVDGGDLLGLLDLLLVGLDLLLQLLHKISDSVLVLFVLLLLEEEFLDATLTLGDGLVHLVRVLDRPVPIQLLEYQMVRALCRFDTLGNLASSQ